MSLPSSGPLSLSQIGTAVGASAPYSLRSMSATAYKSTPDAMSEFYGFNPSGLQLMFTACIGSYPCGCDLGTIGVYGYLGTPAYFTVGYTYYQSNGLYLNENGTESYPYYVDNQPESFTLTSFGTVYSGQGSCID